MTGCSDPVDPAVGAVLLGLVLAPCRSRCRRLARLCMRGGRVVVAGAAAVTDAKLVTVTDAELVDTDTETSVGAPVPVGASVRIGVEVMTPTGAGVASGAVVDEDARGWVDVDVEVEVDWSPSLLETIDRPDLGPPESIHD